MKIKRHATILDIISNHKITTQEELISLLEEQNYKVTQATVSRDIRELRLVKTLDQDGRYYYVVPSYESKDVGSKFYTLLDSTVVHIDYAGNIVVIKCHPGMASATCAALDSQNRRDIVGTLSGDDTFICVMKDENRAIDLASELQKLVRKL